MKKSICFLVFCSFLFFSIHCSGSLFKRLIKNQSRLPRSITTIANTFFDGIFCNDSAFITRSQINVLCASSKSVVEDSTIHNIHVIGNKQQHLHLVNTIVTGDIDFEGEKGILTISGLSNVKGTISGAEEIIRF